MSNKLILDANLFIEISNIQNIIKDYKLYTTQKVIGELKTKKSRDNFNSVSNFITVKEPSKESINFVKKFAENTGDYISLSLADIEIIALGYELIKEDEKLEFLNTTPENKFENDNTIKEKDSDKMWEENKDFESDDDEGWITPNNFQTFNKLSTDNMDKFNLIKTGIITSDFAMQNIIMQIKIPLIDMNGKVITKIKNYVLECYSCSNISRKIGLLFCPSCKYNNLIKVTCEFDENGNFKLFKKKNFQYRKRGNRYNIPEPKGKRKEDDLVFYEDQLSDPNIMKKQKINERRQEKYYTNLNDNYDMGIGFDDIKKKNYYNTNIQIGYGKKNPNNNDFWRNKKKKK